jgi:hypothetical protein
MTNTLVAPTDLADFPGAPFSDALVDSAAGSVRGEAGWHIAPVVTETLRVFSEGGKALLIPSLKYTISEIRDVSGDTPETLTGWTDRGFGILLRTSWPSDHMLEVDVVHGYEACPPELWPVIARYVQAAQTKSTVSQTSLGDFSESYRTGSVSDPVLARFSVRAR